MKKQNRICMVAQYLEFTVEKLQNSMIDWLTFARILTNLETFQVNEEKPVPFVLEEVLGKISEADETSKFTWEVQGKTGKFYLQIHQGTLFFQNIIDEEVFFQQEKMIFDYFDSRMVAGGVYGYLRSYDEYLYSNTAILEERAAFETPEEIKQWRKMFTYDRRVVVDCNQFSGYDIFFRGLCLTSCWKMYYGKSYFQSIPKEILLDVQEVESVIEMENECIQITLFKNPQNWDMEVNKKYQFLFRAQIGVDDLVWDNGVGILRSPYMEYAYKETEIYTVQYFNENGQPAEKKEAKQFITRVTDLENSTHEKHRIRGHLNEQAYFPFIDETGREKMNFRIIYPRFTLDDGVEAYAFYIRHFLELDLKEESQYSHFLPVLNFYLPSEELEYVPVEKLIKQLSDIRFKKIRTKKEKQKIYDLEKGRNRLRIIFSKNKLESKSREQE